MKVTLEEENLKGCTVRSEEEITANESHFGGGELEGEHCVE